jgi:hypothetical protein
MHPDYSVSRSALTGEGNVDAERPQEGLGAMQAAGERTGVAGPAGAARRTAVADWITTDPWKIGGAARAR